MLLIRFLIAFRSKSLTVSVLVWLIARWVVPVLKCLLSTIVRLVPYPFILTWASVSRECSLCAQALPVVVANLKRGKSEGVYQNHERREFRH